MVVQCDTCYKMYNDEHCWTICPHGPLWARYDEYCPKCDTVKRVHGACEHQTNENSVSTT